MVWSALALIGFLALMTFVIGLASASTNRYEREQQARTRSARPATHRSGAHRQRSPRSSGVSAAGIRSRWRSAR